MAGRYRLGWSRVVGERDNWWEDMRRLLAGKPIRRGAPEARAIEGAHAALDARAPDDTATVAFALSHEGSGRRRAVTALAYYRQRWDGTPALEGGNRPAGGRHAMAARRDIDDRAYLASLPVRARYEPGLLGRTLQRLLVRRRGR